MIRSTNLLTPEQAAAFLQLHPNTLANWRHSRRVEIPYVKIGGAVRYRETDLLEFLQRNTTAAPVPDTG